MNFCVTRAIGKEKCRPIVLGNIGNAFWDGERGQILDPVKGAKRVKVVVQKDK